MSNRTRSRLSAVARLVVAGFLLSTLASGGLWQAAHAQGFSVYEQGTCTMARAGAGVANTCNDGSAIFYNPAGLAGTEGLTVSLGATLIAAQGDFTSDYTQNTYELQNQPIPAPHLYLTYGINEKLGVGLGVYVPYGLETEWDPQTFPGAFESYNAAVQSIYIQPTAAYELIDGLRIGAGPIVAIGSVELKQRLDLAQQDVAPGVTFGQLGIPFHTAFADAQLEATGATGYGAHVGLTYDITDRVTIGARYLSQIELDYDGTANFSQVQTGLVIPADVPGTPLQAGTPVDAVVAGQFSGSGDLTKQNVQTAITMPAQVVAGLSVDVTEKLTVMADYHWTEWSSFDQLILRFEKLGTEVRNENYSNTNAFRFGASYDVNEQFTVRGGYLYNEAAAPDGQVTPLLPEADRHHLTAGLGWRPLDLLDVSVSYQYLGQQDRRGRIRGPLPGESVEDLASLNSGLYNFSAHLIGTTFTLHF
ncbi:OmpP1/FadL family transporter [Salisaeta longa]|uniref:OmpP1/FadL family transporter n=1 Tax=Salisaeta longa TaxID=503170 RepID=UPI00068610EA|nr:outer membrane protein transport protein [Salisaeta longa]